MLVWAGSEGWSIGCLAGPRAGHLRCGEGRLWVIHSPDELIAHGVNLNSFPRDIYSLLSLSEGQRKNAEVLTTIETAAGVPKVFLIGLYPARSS